MSIKHQEGQEKLKSSSKEKQKKGKGWRWGSGKIRDSNSL